MMINGTEQPSVEEVMHNRTRVACAQAFAEGAHAAVGQIRNYTGEPYIVHPAEVVEIVSTVEHTVDMLCAAWLHDVVEDTGVTIETIVSAFGERVGTLVWWMTDVSIKERDGKRCRRRAVDVMHNSCADRDGQTLRVADLLSNTKNITARAKAGFARMYLREKSFVLDALTLADPTLVAIARRQIANGEQALGPLWTNYRAWSDDALRREHDAGEWFENQTGLTVAQEERLMEIEREIARRSRAPEQTA